MIYRLYKDAVTYKVNAAMTIDANPLKAFLFDPANTDYQQFKAQVLAGAELQDADGNVMTQEEATAFIKELP